MGHPRPREREPEAIDAMKHAFPTAKLRCATPCAVDLSGHGGEGSASLLDAMTRT
jgi:hypothetical protein